MFIHDVFCSVFLDARILIGVKYFAVKVETFSKQRIFIVAKSNYNSYQINKILCPCCFAFQNLNTLPSFMTPFLFSYSDKYLSCIEDF